MEMGAFRGPGVSEFADRGPGLHGVADLHSDAALTQMRIPGEDIGSDFDHHVVAAIVRRRLRRHQDERRLIGHAVVDRDHGSIGDREHVLAEAIILLDRLAVAVEDSVISDLDQVDREGFSRRDADAVNRDTFVPVNVGLAASGA